MTNSFSQWNSNIQFRLPTCSLPGHLSRTSGMPIQNLDRPESLSVRSQQTLLKQIQLWNNAIATVGTHDWMPASQYSWHIKCRWQLQSDRSPKPRNGRSVESAEQRRPGKMCLMVCMVERGVPTFTSSMGTGMLTAVLHNYSGRAQAVDKPIAGFFRSGNAGTAR